MARVPSTGSAPAAAGHNEFIARLRIGLWIVIAFSAVGILTSLLRPQPPFVMLMGLRIAELGIAAGGLAVLRRATERQAIVLALAVVAVVAGATAASGIATGDSVATRGVCVLLPLATATILSWGLWPQLVVVSLATTAVVWNIRYTSGGLAFLVNYPAVFIGIGGSIYIAHAFHRLSQSEARAVAQLRESEESFRSVIANMQDVVYHNDINGIIRYLSPSVRQFGYEPSELIGQNASAVYANPADQERVRAALLNDGRVSDFEVTLKRKDGGLVTASASARLISAPDGQPAGFEGVLRDITPRKRVEAALRTSEERFRALVQNASDGICVVDAHSVIRYASPAMARITGFEPEELTGSVATQYVHPDDIAALFDGFARVAPGTPHRAEHRLRHRDGTWVAVETTGTVRLDLPAIGGTVLNIRDISDRKRLEEQRADFIAMLVHDIRNPLSAIAGYTDLLLNTEGLPADARAWLSASEQSVQSLLSLVANVLQHSQIEAGCLTLRPQPLAVNELLQRVCTHYRSTCALRRIALDLRLSSDLPRITADANALERVVTNLLDNALKFTPDGGRITVASDERDGEVAIAVSDTGPGIAVAELPHLFSRYRRTASGRSRPGTGLGLFIVKVLVEAHGGRVSVESRLGAGSCFSLMLPLEAQPASGNGSPL